MISKLTKKQVRVFSHGGTDKDGKFLLMVRARHDDECGNGHNTFAISADLYRFNRNDRKILVSCGCLHDLVKKHIEKLRPMLKWHLVSTDAPMHYIANAQYWAGHHGWTDGKPESPPKWNHFKSTVVWGGVPECDGGDPESRFADNKDVLNAWLNRRLELLMANFQTAVESLGFVY